MKDLKKVFSYMGKYKKDAYLLVLFTVFNVAGSVYLTKVISRLIDDGISSANMENLLKNGALMMAVTIFTLVFGILSTQKSGVVSSGLGNNLRLAMMEKLCDFSASDVDYFTRASFINRMTADVGSVQTVVSMILSTAVTAVLNIAFILVASVNMDGRLSLILLVAVPLFSITSLIIVKFAIPYFKRKAKNDDTLSRIVLENLVNMRLIKAFVREDYEDHLYKDAATVAKNNALKAEQITNNSNPLQQLIVNFCVVMILWFGGHRILAGKIQVGELFAFITYINQILYQISLISMITVPAVGSMISVRRVLDVIEKEPALLDVTEDMHENIADGSIDFEGVYFDYSENVNKEDMLLRNLNLHIKPGENIGIVGATGSGKTSLVNLLPRLFDIPEGTIKIGGADISHIPLKRLRESIAFTTQKSVLFSGSIAENLKEGKPDATEEEMIKACEEACIYDFIKDNEKGFDMELSEGGSNVSGGQKQRLCLARAFIKKAPVLVMDDCTSALDKATERAVIDHITGDFKDRTKILISSKISSIKRMDRIVVLDKGEIVGLGTHEELVASNAIYKDLCISQGEV